MYGPRYSINSRLALATLVSAELPGKWILYTRALEMLALLCIVCLAVDSLATPETLKTDCLGKLV